MVKGGVYTSYLSSNSKEVSWAIKNADSEYILSSRELGLEGVGLVESISATLAALLARHSIKTTDIAEYVFCHGPGSFTSLRTAYSFLQALCTSTNSSLVGLSHFLIHFLSHRSEHKKDQVLAINANRSENFVVKVSILEDGRFSLTEPFIVLKEDELYSQSIIIPEELQVVDLVTARSELEVLAMGCDLELKANNHLVSGNPINSYKLMYIKGVAAKTLVERGVRS